MLSCILNLNVLCFKHCKYFLLILCKQVESTGRGIVLKGLGSVKWCTKHIYVFIAGFTYGSIVHMASTFIFVAVVRSKNVFTNAKCACMVWLCSIVLKSLHSFKWCNNYSYVFITGFTHHVAMDINNMLICRW